MPTIRPVSFCSEFIWRYISDKVMRGLSDGQDSLEHDGEIYIARLTGNVNTKK
jgi:hypothetical protein